MSMLAGPRRKQKVINLRAKNSAWSNDSNKFGQRMLEKMGWSAGKGLGVKENGIVEHVVARFKNDEKGLGFEDKNDQWTKHEDDFNALLANLSNTDSNSDVLHSGVSLEKKSKKSKTRIHYHKFTRGKDLSRYSEKDLANIFGKKSFKEKVDEEPVKEDVKTSERVFTEKGNMDDYFKNKLAGLKSKYLNTEKNTKEDDVLNDGICDFSTGFEAEIEHTAVGFGYQPFACDNIEKDSTEQESTTSIPPNVDVEMSKLKKKKSKNKDRSVNNEENKIVHDYEEFQSTANEKNVINIDIPKNKKSKKKKGQIELQNQLETNVTGKKIKKKCEKDKVYNDHEKCLSLEDYVPKKKKRKN